MIQRKLGKIGIFGIFTFCSLFVGTNYVNAQELNSVIASNTTITSDVVLKENITINNNATLLVAANTNVTIDLNGFIIDKKGENNYAINNNGGTIKIIDSGATKGKITCESIKSSCIRNNGTLTIDGIEINSHFTSVKTEEETTTTIKNSTLIAKHDSTIMNYGKINIENSSIINESIDKINNVGTALYSLTYNNYSSSITVKNSTLDADYGIITRTMGTKDENTTNKIELNDVVINSNSLIDLREPDVIISVSGEVTAPIIYAEYAESGTKIILNADVPEGTYTIPENVTIDAKNVTLAENSIINLANDAVINLPDDKSLVKQADGSFKILERANYSKLNQVVSLAKALDSSFYTEESFKVLSDALNSVVYELGEDNQAEVDGYVTAIENAMKNLKLQTIIDVPNPNTSDTIISLIIAALISLSIIITSCVYLKREMN